MYLKIIRAPLLVVFFILWLSGLAAAEQTSFHESKKLLRHKVFYDQHNTGTFYCGCKFEWAGKSGGVIDLKSCNYEARKNHERASRLEWEHILPAQHFGKALTCWQNGGRNNCTRTDPYFSRIEGDMHNLVPSVGEVNGDRSNFQFSQFNSTSLQYGACTMVVDFKNKIVSPPDHTKGRIARTYFYMHDRYNLNMSKQQAQLLIAWDKRYPVSTAEKLIHNRIAELTGIENDFVTGRRTWSLNHKNLGLGRSLRIEKNRMDNSIKKIASKNILIKGNKRSKIYHLEQSCVGYNQVSEKNTIAFNSVEDAEKAGYRKARNCFD